MSLAGRFQLLLAIFGVSIVANVLVSVACIHIYIREATEQFSALTMAIRETDQLEQLVNDLVTDLHQAAERESPVRNYRYRLLHEKLTKQTAHLAELLASDTASHALRTLQDTAADMATDSETYMQALSEGRRDEAATLLTERVEAELQTRFLQALRAIEEQGDIHLTGTTQRVADQETAVTVILAINAILAFLLAAVGVHLVRNWVLKPVDALKIAAEQHAAGNLDYRIPKHSKDELGTLSREINRMADSLIEIQKQLVERERMAAVGEVAATLAHNIRNPLAGIRASAQSSQTLAEELEEADLQQLQLSIMETVDSLSKWLRELLMVSRPITPVLQPASLPDLVERVCRVLQSSAQRRGIKLNVEQSGNAQPVDADAALMEQAVLSIVANAIDASPHEAEVLVRIELSKQRKEASIRVIDQGEGIAPEVMQRIASAYFSTKPGGTGIGLHLAKRIVQSHDGRIEFRNNDGGGTTVAIHWPMAAAARPTSHVSQANGD